MPKGSPYWICGDCHVGNLGPLADSKGKIHIQIRDLDQTVIGNPNHDLIRLALSLSSAARGSDLPALGERMMPARLLGRSVFLRELMPQDLKLEIEQLTREEAVSAARYLASVVGGAHARQMDSVTRREFRSSLRDRRPRRLNARPGCGRASWKSRRPTKWPILSIVRRIR